MKKKYIAVLFGVMFGITILGGCSGADTAATENTSADAEASAEGNSEKDGSMMDADIYGEVNAVGDSSITVKVGTMKQMEQRDHSGSEETEESERPSMLELTGEEQEIMVTDDTVIVRMSMGGGPQGGGDGAMRSDGERPENGEIPEKPEGGEASENGEIPQPPESQEASEKLTDGEQEEAADTEESAKERQGMLSEDEENRRQPESEQITLTDIAEGDTVAVTLDEDGKAARIMVMSMGKGREMPSGQPGQSSDGVENYEAVNACTSDTELEGDTISSVGTDENAIYISEGASVSMKEITVSRTSADSMGGDNASFYGVGAAILTTDGTAYVSESYIDTDAAGGAGIFAYGNGTVYAADTEITTQKDTSGGIHAAGGGTLYAWDMDVETNGESAAAIRSDRGGGKIVVDGGSYTSNGIGSPAIYSTADIAVNDAQLTANGSEAVCIEGLNALHLYDSDLTGNMSDDDRNDCTWNVILYQSMSGDSEIGNSIFEMSGGTLTARNGGMFYTTNTESTITLSDVDITNAAESEFFLKCTGNVNERGWGQSGANGADCLFTGIDQDMEGDIIWDSISKLDFYMTEGSTLEGAVIKDESCAGDGGEGYCNLYIGEDCTWTVTGDSILSALHCGGKLVDEEGKSVTVKGSDGTVYAKGDGSFTVTVDSYEENADLSGAAETTSWADYEKEKPEQLMSN